MASAMIRVKAFLSGDARRFSVRRTKPGLPMVRSALAETYSIAPDSFEIRYRDDEGDMINVRTEGDWTEAVDAVEPGGTVRLDVISGSDHSPAAWELVSGSELAELATSPPPVSQTPTGEVPASILTSAEHSGGINDNSTPTSPGAEIAPARSTSGSGSDRSISVSSTAQAPEAQPQLEPAKEATESPPSSEAAATNEQKIAEVIYQVVDGIQAAAEIVADESSELGEMVREAFDGVVQDITNHVKLEQHEAAAATGNDSTNTTEETTSAKLNEPVLHPNIICDGCNCAIIGTRFKSLTHPDFDLCATCEATGMHPEHIMIRIRTPSQKASWLAAKLQHVVARCHAFPGCHPGPQGCAMKPPFWAQFVPPGVFRHHGPPHGRGRHGHHGPKYNQRGSRRHHGSGRHHHPGDPKFTPVGDQLPTGRLERGSHGPGVAQLQHFLIKAGLMDPSAIRWTDGLFGPRTAAAIQAFQEVNQLEGEHGVFDTRVRAALLAGWPTAATATQAPDASSPVPVSPPIASVDEPTGEEFVLSSMAPSAPSTDEQPVKWSEQLETLHGMGFCDVEKNSELLNKHNGAVPFVVTELLQ